MIEHLVVVYFCDADACASCSFYVMEYLVLVQLSTSEADRSASVSVDDEN